MITHLHMGPETHHFLGFGKGKEEGGAQVQRGSRLDYVDGQGILHGFPLAGSKYPERRETPISQSISQVSGFWMTEVL